MIMIMIIIITIIIFFETQLFTLYLQVIETDNRKERKNYESML